MLKWVHAAATYPNSAALSPHTGPAPPTVGYQRRDPEQTLLHQTVRAHWNTLLAEVAQRTDGGSLPGFVRMEFERYLACGVLAHGFARVHCGSCGEDILVACSCKSRGICPSCTTRRMQGTAIHLLEHVLPRVPVRQWVLSLPRWARFLLARDPALITRTLGLSLREIFKHHRRRARRAGARDPRQGAIVFVQRFGGALNLNCHFYAIIPDGNFVREDGVVHFEGLGPPTDDELLVIVQRIAARVNKLLRPRREAALDDARTPDAYASAQAESVSAIPSAPRGEERAGGRTGKKCSAYFEGFSLHAGVHLHASDREGLAHLVGYGARSRGAERCNVASLQGALAGKALRAPRRAVGDPPQAPARRWPTGVGVGARRVAPPTGDIGAAASGAPCPLCWSLWACVKVAHRGRARRLGGSTHLSVSTCDGCRGRPDRRHHGRRGHRRARCGKEGAQTRCQDPLG